MLAFQSLFLVALFASWTAATPINQYNLRLERGDSELDILARQELTGPVTFQTVTTTQTQAGTIIQTCIITLTPETAQDGSQDVREDKECQFQVNTSGESSPPSNGNGSGDSSSVSSTAAIPSSTSTATQIQDTNTVNTSIISSGATATDAPPISAIGVNTIPASQAGTDTASVSQPVATASASPDPAFSVIGTSQVTNSATETTSPTSSSSATTPVTVVSTLADGSVSTSVSTPSPAAAQEAAATTPGRKLEVLPIGLGVFAGVSVIALIVVGLVTFERTRYRKAFRQRKLAEAGANMGYGGMADRT